MSLLQLCGSIILIAGTLILLILAVVIAIAIIKGTMDAFYK